MKDIGTQNKEIQYDRDIQRQVDKDKRRSLKDRQKREKERQYD